MDQIPMKNFAESSEELQNIVQDQKTLIQLTNAIQEALDLCRDELAAHETTIEQINLLHSIITDIRAEVHDLSGSLRTLACELQTKSTPDTFLHDQLRLGISQLMEIFSGVESVARKTESVIRTRDTITAEMRILAVRNTTAVGDLSIRMDELESGQRSLASKIDDLGQVVSREACSHVESGFRLSVNQTEIEDNSAQLFRRYLARFPNWEYIIIVMLCLLIGGVFLSIVTTRGPAAMNNDNSTSRSEKSSELGTALPIPVKFVLTHYSCRRLDYSWLCSQEYGQQCLLISGPAPVSRAALCTSVMNSDLCPSGSVHVCKRVQAVV